MSRSCYTDDYGDEFPGQLALFRANVDRSMRSKAGQARLRELRDALLALPVKALERETFAQGRPDSPEVCALGAWALAKSGGDVEAAGAMVPADADDYETYDALKPHGWPRLVVLDVIYFNDEIEFVYDEFLGPHRSPYAYHTAGDWPVRYGREETGAERYARILEWVESRLFDRA